MRSNTSRPGDYGAANSAWSPSALGSNVLARFLDGQKYATSQLNGLHVLQPQEPSGTFRAPRRGRCWLFDGLNDFIATGVDIPATNSNQITMCARVKSSATTSFSGIFEKNNTALGRNFWLGINHSTPALQLWSAAGLISSVRIERDRWYHVAAVIDGINWAVYIDGVLSQSGATTWTNTATGIANMFIGGQQLSFMGNMWDVRFYTAAKTAEQIAAIAAGDFAAPDVDGLHFGYWCTEEDGTVAYDWGPNALHGTITNATLATFHAVDSAVTVNPNNVHGYRLSSGVYIPARIGTSLAADGNALTHTGRTPYPATVETPCVTGDGTGVYVDLGSPLIPATGDWEIECDYYHSLNDTNQRSIFKNRGGTTPNGFVFLIANSSGTAASSGGLAFGIHDSVSPMILATTGLVANTWHRVKVSRTGNAFSLTHTPAGSSAVTATGNSLFTVAQNNLSLLRDDGPSPSQFNAGRIANLRITKGGVTKHFPLQDGPGSSNTNRNIAWVASDGTGGVISNAIVGGTVANIWQNFCPGYVQDHCINHGGRLAANGSFIGGIPGTNLAADGNALTLAAGKHGNPYSRLNTNPFNAAEANGRNWPTALVPGASLGITPSNSAFRRTADDGDDRFFVVDDTLDGSDLTNAEAYVE